MRSSLLLLILSLALPSASLAGPNGAPRLQRISFARTADGNARLVRLHLDGRVTAFSDPRSDSNGRLEVTLYNVIKAPDFLADDPQSPVLQYETDAVRGHLRLVVSVQGSVLSDVFRDMGSNDLFLTLAPAGATVSVDARATGALSPRPVSFSPPGGPGPAATTGREFTGVEEAAAPEIARAASRWKVDRIVIDAGHGGHDPGAIGAGRIREKDIVLPVALKLGEYLKANLDVEVVYTRKDDTFMALRERGRTANAANASLFISIHANSAANTSAHGTETYFLGMNKESAAQKVIERENSVIQLEQDQSHYDQFDQAALVRYQLAQSAFLQKSEELASRIEHQFSERAGRKSRGVKEGNLQVLWAAAMPAVLVELGFVSNPEEARYMRSEEGITYLASAIFRAVRDYKTALDTSLSIVSDR